MTALRLVLVGCLLLVLTTVSQADKSKAKPVDGAQLVGIWEPQGGDAPPGATIEFTKDGKMIISIPAEGKTVSIEGTFTLKGDELTTTYKAGKEVTETMTITTLTEDKMITKDAKGKVDTFKKKK